MKNSWGGQRKGAGRPRGEMRTEVLTVRIPADLMDELKDRAYRLDEQGKEITLSARVTELLRDALSRLEKPK